MKDTGKTFKGIKIYIDPEVPPGMLFLLNDDYKNLPPKHNGKIKNIKS